MAGGLEFRSTFIRSQNSPTIDGLKRIYIYRYIISVGQGVCGECGVEDGTGHGFYI